MGDTETCLSGTFSNVSSFTYTFVLSGTTIQVASSSSTIKLKTTALGKQLSCVVTAIGPGGTHAVTTQSRLVLVGPQLSLIKGTMVTGKAKGRFDTEGQGPDLHRQAHQIPHPVEA